MSGKGPQVLVVDDDPSHNLVISAVLKKLGIHAHVTSSAADFLTKIKSIRPSLCLVDLNIGELRVGYSIIQALRNVLGESLPIIVISGRSSREAVTHAMELGANDYVVKPIESEMLASKLSRFLVTEQLDDSRPQLLPVPNGGAPASVDLEMRIHEVDEFGVLVSSQHVLAKGAVFQVDSPLMRKLTGMDGPSHLRVVSTWLGEDQRSYCSFLEFDHSNGDLMANIRRWLTQCQE